MSATPVRGRPRTADLERIALEHTIAILEERGYDGLRMKDVAAAAGIGLGAMYRRWAGKQELVAAALRADIGRHDLEATDDPEADLLAALVRVSEAVPRGLGKLFAVSLTDPGSELARVAVEAKLEPMAQALARWLERVTGPAADLEERAENGIAWIIWHAARRGTPPDQGVLRERLLPLMVG